MGKHGKRGREQRPKVEPLSELAKLVDPNAGWPSEYPEDRPTSDDLWAKDKYYDSLDMIKGNRIRVIGAVALCLVFTGVVGSIGWMFGTGNAEGGGAVATKTVDHPAVTKTETSMVTLTSQPRVVAKTVTEPAGPPATVTTTVNPVLSSLLRPSVGPTKTVTPKPVVSIKISKITPPTVTVTIERCFGRWRDGATDEIECP